VDYKCYCINGYVNKEIFARASTQICIFDEFCDTPFVFKLWTTYMINWMNLKSQICLYLKTEGVLHMENVKVHILLGIPFLATARTMLGVQLGELVWISQDAQTTFNDFEVMRYQNEHL